MKTTLQLCICLFLCTVISVSAQSEATLENLLERLNQNHMTRVTDVFTPSEIEILQAHFNEQNGEEPSQSSSVLEVEVFATENTNGNFGHFNTNNPSVFNPIAAGGAADFEGAGAYDPFTGLVFIIDNAGNGYAVDPVTGLYTGLGLFTAPSGESFTGLEFDPVSGNVYGISTDGNGSSTLSIINPATNQVTVIGNTQLVLAIALAFDLSGTWLYAYDIDIDMMYRINKTTAVATALGAIGFDASFGQGMFLDPATGNICMTAFNNTAFRAELRMVDTTTGTTTLVAPIGNTSPGGNIQFAWSSTLNSTFGIGDATGSTVQYYPNPAGDQLNVSTEGVPIERLALYNTLGQKIQETTIEESFTTLDVSRLAKGIYLLEVSISGIQQTYRFVKE